MENHPVPQNISSYEFHLVGDMTLKQFLQLAGGILVGYMFFRLEIIAVVKYPLAGLSVLIGVLLAFIPINGRPFSSWLSAFVKAIYSPTEFVWIPQAVIDSVLPPPPVTPVTAPSPASPPASKSASPPISAPPPPPAKPAPAHTIVLPSFSEFIASKLHRSGSVPVGKETTTSKVFGAPTTPPSAPNSQPVATSAPSDTASSSPSPASSISQPTPTLPTAPTTSSVSLYTKSSQLPQTSTLVSAPSAPTTSLISSPTSPNILSGLITDDANQPLPQITVEIVDTNTGIPARALRTNKLGQFQIAIPLPAGTYNILAEKEGLKFDPVSIQVKGNIVPPVILQGKKV